ncbi:hypothetical protein [Ewingella americana]|uniref:Uncharacterized protein n=1 Tax=Ewingella americana TaxID=41202 RepID=A0A502GFS7_9GAMM|nr:hypothetical protein [Ewingella americana]TPG60150.1 hypothetical protein EAH77_16405 [Ewingella americana]
MATSDLKTYTIRVARPTADSFDKLLANNQITYLKLLRRFIEQCIEADEISLDLLDDGQTEEELCHVIEQAELAKKILAARKAMER